MDKEYITLTTVDETCFLVTLVARNLVKEVTIYGAYDNHIYLTGNKRVLTNEVLNSFRQQPEIIDLEFSPTSNPDRVNCQLTLGEGSNFFELDFSALNKELDGTEHSQFRW